MRKSRYSEEQIIRVLQEVESGRTVREVCREHGIATATFYAWKSRTRSRSAESLEVAVFMPGQ